MVPLEQGWTTVSGEKERKERVRETEKLAGGEGGHAESKGSGNRIDSAEKKQKVL